MNQILNTIIRYKHKEIAYRKSLVPQSQLEGSAQFLRPVISLSKRLMQSNTGIIAEHKRRSPSKAVINNSLYIDDVAKGYEQAGVAGMSVLTDNTFFGGSLDDLLTARAVCQLPLLRKDFIIDPYQIVEARAFGADVILLIAACLDTATILTLTKFAQSLQMEVLLEVHDEDVPQRKRTLVNHNWR